MWVKTCWYKESLVEILWELMAFVQDSGAGLILESFHCRFRIHGTIEGSIYRGELPVVVSAMASISECRM